MGLRGPKPKKKGGVKIKWSSNFAYAIGLLASDGCLSSDGRHIILTSRDREQLENYMLTLTIRFSLIKLKIKVKRYHEVNLAMYCFIISS